MLFFVFLFVCFCLWSFSHTPLLSSFLFWGVSLTRPVLASFLTGEFLLHIPCWLPFYLGSFSYTSHAGFIFMWGVSLTHPMLTFLFNFFILNLGSFSYTSHAGLFLTWGVSLTHPVLAKFFCGEFLLHIPWWLYFCVGSFSSFINLGSFSYTSRAGFIFIWGVSLTHPVLPSFYAGFVFLFLSG